MPSSTPGLESSVEVRILTPTRLRATATSERDCRARGTAVSAPGSRSALCRVPSTLDSGLCAVVTVSSLTICRLHTHSHSPRPRDSACVSVLPRIPMCAEMQGEMRCVYHRALHTCDAPAGVSRGRETRALASLGGRPSLMLYYNYCWFGLLLLVYNFCVSLCKL